MTRLGQSYVGAEVPSLGPVIALVTSVVATPSGVAERQTAPEYQVERKKEY